MSRSFSENFDKLIEQESLDRTEGRKGVENLATLVHFLGYSDFQHYGQFNRSGAALGDIIEFLEDNPGAIKALQNWIRDNGSDGTDWDENIKSELDDNEALERIEELTREQCVSILSTSDSYDVIEPNDSVEDLRRSIKMALEDEEIEPEDILDTFERVETDV